MQGIQLDPHVPCNGHKRNLTIDKATDKKKLLQDGGEKAAETYFFLLAHVRLEWEFLIFRNTFTHYKSLFPLYQIVLDHLAIFLWS